MLWWLFSTGEAWAPRSPAPRRDWVRGGRAGCLRSGSAAHGGVRGACPLCRAQAGGGCAGQEMVVPPQRGRAVSPAGTLVGAVEVPGSPTVSGAGGGGAEGKDFSVSISAEL